MKNTCTATEKTFIQRSSYPAISNTPLTFFSRFSDSRDDQTVVLHHFNLTAYPCITKPVYSSSHALSTTDGRSTHTPWGRHEAYLQLQNKAILVSQSDVVL